MIEKVESVKKQNILQKFLTSTKGKYVVGTLLLSGIGIALPRIFHILAGANAGATFPYGKDPKDSNIRIAPSFPSLEEMEQAAELFTLCVNLVSVEKLLEV